MQAVAAWTSATVVTVRLSVPLAGAVIRYTHDGTAPTPSSPVYRGPFAVRPGRVPLRLRAAAFFHGRAGSVSECALVRTTPAELRRHRHASASWSALVSP